MTQSHKGGFYWKSERYFSGLYDFTTDGISERYFHWFSFLFQFLRELLRCVGKSELGEIVAHIFGLFFVAEICAEVIGNSGIYASSMKAE